MTVGAEFKFDEMERFAGGDDGIVQGDSAEAAVGAGGLAVAGVDAVLVGENGDFDGHARPDGEAVVQREIEVFGQFVRGEAGEETEAAEVDAHQRDLPAVEAAGGGEQGAIAAEDQHQIGFERPEVAVIVVNDSDDVRLLADAREDLLERGGHVRFVAVDDDQQSHV